MNSFMSTWNDPHTRHAMLVHFPIVLGTLGVIPFLVLAAMRFKPTIPKVAATVLFLIASATTYLAIEAGEESEERVERAQAPLTAAEKTAIHDHEELAENGWIWPLIPACLAALTLVRAPKVRATAGVLGIAAALGVGGWVALTAKAGGEIVYGHGLGVPARTPAAPAPDAPPGPAVDSDQDDRD